MKILELQGVSYRYDGSTVALEDVSFSADEGEKIALIGPNGAGKSTLLNLIAGFRMPFSGRVTIRSRDLAKANADELRREVGLVFQDPEDQIFMPTVEEDVAFGPRNLNLGNIEGLVLEAMRATDIESLAKRRTHKLSHGMKKRVAIAGVLAMQPSILLLDEPTSGLDPRARSELVTLLRGTRRTMLIATHDLEAAAEIVDRAIVLDARIIMEGPMREVVMAKDVLRRAGLEMPAVSRLFDAIGAMGYPVESLPVTQDQAVAEMVKVVGKESADRVGHRKAKDHLLPGDRGGR